MIKVCYALAILSTIHLTAQSEFQRVPGEKCHRTKVKKYHDEPGYALAVFTQDSVLVKINNGLANLNSKTLIDNNTAFNVASVSKTFTSAAILKLVEEGQLKMDGKLTSLLPSWPSYANKVTIRNLLNHSSGLPEYTEWDNFNQSEFNNDQVFKMLEESDSLYFQPGSKFQYSNTAFVVLSRVIEKISGERFTDYIRENLLKPLEMNSTYFAGEMENTKKALGYIFNPEIQKFELNDSKGYLVIGSTGMYSTVEDLIKWMRAFKDSGIITDFMKEQMFAYPIDKKGHQGFMNMGWFNETIGKHSPELRGLQQDGQIGVTHGFRSYLISMRQFDFYYIMLSNRGELPYEVIGSELLSCYFERKM